MVCSCVAELTAGNVQTLEERFKPISGIHVTLPNPPPTRYFRVLWLKGDVK
jgi:hypothetical protein